MDRGIDGGGRSRGLNLEVNNLVLKPVLAFLSALAFWLPRGGVVYRGVIKEAHHSLNLSTQIFKSPLVSNLGYVTALTVMLGSA